MEAIIQAVAVLRTQADALDDAADRETDRTRRAYLRSASGEVRRAVWLLKESMGGRPQGGVL
jgi:hypothetical protein